MEDTLAFLEHNFSLFQIIALSLAVCAGFWVLSILLNRKLLPALQKRAERKNHKTVCLLLTGFKRPLSFYLKLVGICVAVLIFFTWQPIPSTAFYRYVARLAPSVVYKALRILTILFITWGLVASSGISALILKNARNRLDLHISKGVTRFLAAIYNVVVVAIAAAILLNELGYDINGLVAGLGLGGLTIALAAKDSASNFFGGLVLVMEKPFEIGDWITCKDVEGSVEDINLRSTMVRTASGALTVIPNSILSAEAITNWSGAMEKRRADIILSLEYSTSQKALRSYCADVRMMLENDTEIITDSVMVRFAELAASSLDVKVVFFTTMAGYSDHMRVKERVNYAIMELAAKHEVGFAYPTSSVYLHPHMVEKTSRPDTVYPSKDSL